VDLLLNKFDLISVDFQSFCYKQQDITDVVTGTIDATTTAADDATTATALANVASTSEAAAATTNPGV